MFMSAVSVIVASLLPLQTAATAASNVSYSVLPILQTPAVADAETTAAHRATNTLFALLLLFTATILLVCRGIMYHNAANPAISPFGGIGGNTPRKLLTFDERAIP